MTAPETMHPSEETLAGFIEGRLDPAARKQVLQHLDVEDCGECREVLLLVAEAAETAEAAAMEEAVATEEPPLPNVVHGRFGKRLWIPLGAAAAAVVVLLLVLPAVRRSEVQRIAEATESLKSRISDARLSVDVPYRPKPAVMRNVSRIEPEAASNLQFLQAARRLQEGSRGDPIDRLQAKAAVYLYLGDTDLAFQNLEEALKRADAEKLAPKRKAAILNDLAVVRLRRGDKGNLIAALDAIERARALDDASPSIAWTRAVLLETVDRKTAALQAWQDYLRLDSSSAWAVEARERVTDLQR